MRKGLIGVIVGLLIGAAAAELEAQYFASFYRPADMFEDNGALTDEGYFVKVRLGYSSGVVDTLEFVTAYMAMSKKSFEEDYTRMAAIAECLKFRGSTRGALEAHARGVWWRAKESKESAAALLAVSCSDVVK